MRSFVSATIAFGLVSIPVKFYVSASDESLSFNNITKAGNRVKIKYVDAVTGEDAPYDSCVKGYEFAKDQFVTFTAEELKELELSASKTIDIQEFVPADSIDFVQIEKTYYLGPDKGGDKGYALLSDVLKAQGKVAIAQWVNKGKEHLVLLRPYRLGLALQILYYHNEVRDFNEIEVAPLPISEAEQALAHKLVEALSSDEFEADKYDDRYAKILKSVVDAKVNGREVIIPQDANTKSTLDLFSALKATLEQAKPKVKTPKTKKGKK
jgi:DNA end-binding protein Ku